MSYTQFESDRLPHGQLCQNDVWLCPGNPNAPALGDIRMIVQKMNPFLSFAHAEVWMDCSTHAF